MRSAILIIAGVAVSLACFGCGHQEAAEAALTEEARLAVDLRCRSGEDAATQSCRRTLTRLYLAGSLDPDQTLRAWCDSVKTARWGGSRPAPPKVCVERYGGWQEG